MGHYLLPFIFDVQYVITQTSALMAWWVEHWLLVWKISDLNPGQVKD